MEQAKWIYNHDTQTISNGDKTLNVGDIITGYDSPNEDYTGNWRVLGAENGKILLVSANYVPFEGNEIVSDLPVLRLEGAEGYNNGADTINAIGATYADGVKTENGRGLTIEDINTITGYDPTNTYLNASDLTQRGPFIAGYTGPNTKYGDTVTYKIISNKVKFSIDGGTTYYQSNYAGSTFKPLGVNTSISGDETCTIKETFYRYYPETLGTFEGTSVTGGKTDEGLSTSSPAYDMIFNLAKTNNKSYWLASPCIFAAVQDAFWSLHLVSTSRYCG